jgi:hypothetical protein
VAETSSDGEEKVLADLLGLQTGGEGGQTGGSMCDGSRIGAMEDVFKVFVVEGGATRASAIEGAFAIALVTVGESGEETIHELVGSIAATAKAPTESLLDVDPFDVFEDLDRPVFNLHDVFPGGALHHPLAEKVSTASGVRDAANNKVAGG